MRTYLLIFCTIVVLGGAFLAYVWMEPAAPPKPNRALTTLPAATEPRSPTTQGLRGLGVGEAVWVKRYDPSTGELSSQFKADKYDPQPGGTVLVEKPQAEFFTNDGSQRLRVEGEHGTVVMNLPPEEQPGKLQVRSGSAAQAPTRGRLEQVAISMFEPADAAEPILVARMNNAVFDNDTFRIATDSYADEQGQQVEASEVPVVVRGRDYDFNGRGLVIRWNERDRRLQLLEVAHGESLTVKNPSALAKDAVSRAPARGGKRVALVSADPASVRLALATPQPNNSQAARRRRAAAAAAAAAPPPPEPAEAEIAPAVYRATFERDVRIFEGEQQIVAADSMTIDLLQSDRDATTQPSDEPAGAQPSSPAKKERRGNDPAATNPDDFAGPVVIRWNGKLRVVPLEETPETNLVPGRAAVQLIGAPVRLTRGGTEATSGVVYYNSADDTGSLRASDAVPMVTLTDARGATVTSPQIDFAQLSPTQRLATLTGNSRAEFPVEGENGQTEQVVATWSNQCQLHLADDGGQRAAIERADLDGDVKVDHPQLKLSADALALAFDPASPRPAEQKEASAAASLREIVASGNVDCRILEGEEPRTIQARKLRVETDRAPDGRTYAKLIQADGDVVTTDGDGRLEAAQLVAELAPATQPVAGAGAGSAASTAVANAEGALPVAGGFADQNVRLLSLVARQDVKLTAAGGASALADTLTVQTDPARRETYVLNGEPATVTDGDTIVTGQTIRFAPSAQLAEIPGPGTIRGTQGGDEKQTMEIAWAGGAIINGNTDRIDVTERVFVRATQADGTVNAASSKRLRARLGPKIDQAQKAPPAPTTRPSAEKMNFLAGKDVVAATLFEDVEVKSELTAADGTLARGMNLFAEAVTFDRQTGRLEVPVAGRMLYQDRRPPDQPRPNQGPTLGSGRGATAFEWSKWLVYEQQPMRATMTGDVQVVHHPDGPNAQPFNLRAQTLVAELEPDPDAQKPRGNRAQAAPPAPAGDPQGQLRLKRVTAHEKVQVTSSRLNVEARRLAFDPTAHVLTAFGDDADPITVVDNVTGSTSTAAQLEWNTQTDHFRISQLGGRVRP